MAQRDARGYEAVLDWWQDLADDVRDAEIADFSLEFGYHSTKLEHSEVHFEEAREVFELGTVTAYTGDVRSLTSLSNQKVTFDWMLRCLARSRPVDEGFLMEMHRMLVGGTFSRRQLADGERPGTYKLSDYFVRETHEVGALPSECPGLTRALLAEIAAVMPTLTPPRALTAAAYLHNELVSIHPFSEGTGRVARELSNYVLLSGGHPPIIIYEDDRDRYFATLEEFDDTGDLEPFKEFLRHETVMSWADRVR